jgi:hypothetical protein
VTEDIDVSLKALSPITEHKRKKKKNTTQIEWQHKFATTIKKNSTICCSYETCNNNWQFWAE